MPILAADAGNSRIKWGLWDGGWSHQGWVETSEVARLAIEWRPLPAPRLLVACSVAPPVVAEWMEAWTGSSGVTLRWVVSQREECGVRNGYLDPSQLGADRWAALIAAHHLVSGAVLTASIGTAVTVDALAQDGEFMGGLILPGLDLMAEALASGTAGLTRGQGTMALFPRSTADAIASGAVQSICGAIERMERVLSQRHANPQILLTGGGAEVIRSHLQRTSQLVPNLVLEGLRIVAARELA